MAGYSGTPLWKKLGYKDDIVVHADAAPKGYIDSLALPSDISVKWDARVCATCSAAKSICAYCSMGSK